RATSRLAGSMRYCSSTFSCTAQKWTWASVSPGMRVAPWQSWVVTGPGSGPTFPLATTSLMRSSSTTTAAPSRGSAPVQSMRKAFVKTVRLIASRGGGGLDGAAIPRRLREGDGPHGGGRAAGLPVGLDVRAGRSRVAHRAEHRGHVLRDLPVSVEGLDPVGEAAGLQHRAIEGQGQVPGQLAAEGGHGRLRIVGDGQ